ncbi:MAG: LysR family transcriptional regulator [Pseudobdellovibrio sp.]
MDLNEVYIFIKVVQTGSFSQAAKQLDMPNSTVSYKVSSLEKRLGTTLITRTTRRLKVTPAGEAYFKKCLQGFEEIKSGEDEIAASQGDPQGLLRVTAPVELGASILPGIVSAYMAKFPKVGVEVILTDRRVELLAEGVDLAIRAGEMKDSTLIGKKLGYGSFFPMCSPQYIKKFGEPAHPRDLKNHQCLHFTPLGSETWKLKGPTGSLNVSVPGKVIINDMSMLRALVISGMGIALLPSFYCNNETKSGKLVRILQDWKTTPSPIQFVYPAQKFVSPKLSAFIEMATDPIRQSLKAD